jgi:iron complex transport system ATP-binding protein
MLKTEGISFTYGGRPVLEGIDFRVASGELCSILGNNGAGKSTLLKCLVGILRPQGGVILLNGDETDGLHRREMARRQAYVAQRGGGEERLTVFDVVLMGRRPHITWGVSERDLQVVQGIMDDLELQDLALRYVDELSGGEYQKVMIARALAQEPGVLLLDEPTSNLDLRNQFEVMKTVKRMVEERGIAAVMAIHDINLALRFSDRFMLLARGTVLACGGPEIITAENVERTYGIKVRLEQVGDRDMIVPQ